MPPRRAGPARPPTSPPSLKITSPIVKTVMGGKGSAFKPLKSFKPLKPIEEVEEIIGDDKMDEDDEKLTLRYMKANEAHDWLEEAIRALKIGYRRNQGEIFPDENSSSDEVDEEFDLGACEEACGVTPDEIIDFVWDYAPNVQVKFGSKRQMDYVLSCEPKDLVVYLGQALDKAAMRIGPKIPLDEVEENHELAIKYTKASSARIWLEEVISSPNKDDEEFDINACEEACGVTPDDIIDFVWDYTPDIEVKFGSKRRMDYVLSYGPKDLLKYLSQALDEVAAQIGPDIP